MRMCAVPAYVEIKVFAKHNETASQREQNQHA